MFTKPFDYFKVTADFFKSIPTKPDDIKEILEKVKKVFESEAKNTADIWRTYQKATTDSATPDEIAAANEKATALLKTTQFAFLIALPGSIFLLPLLVEFAKSQGVDIIPESVKKEFDI